MIRERVPVTLDTTTRGIVVGGRVTTLRNDRLHFFVQAILSGGVPAKGNVTLRARIDVGYG
jgi:hypothetical protein